MILDRKNAPAIQPITQIELLDIEAKKISNGIPFYHLEGGDQEVISLGLVFPAGRWYEDKPLQSFFTASMLLEGTKNRTSQQVAEWIDFHGAEFSITASYDVAVLNLVCLARHIKPMMELFADVLQNPVFDVKELDIKRNTTKQKHQINLQKTDFVAQRKFHNLAFGDTHAYGYSSSVEKYDAITVDDLHQFYQKQYVNSKPFAILSGKCSTQQLGMIEQELAALATGNQDLAPVSAILPNYGELYLPFENANQTSIRLGIPSILPNHADFGKLQLTNAILGGYFGSRLMSNLREEKGLTYGVYSHLGAFLNSGYWFVGTDVGKDQRELALAEIKKEIEKLQQERVPVDELELVRNYVMGKFLARVDGPFAQAKLFQSLILQHLNATDFQHRIDQILSTTVEDVQAMAQKYFTLDEIVEVMVG